MDDELKINTLFLAMTRPAMTMGVTHEYFIINLFFSMSLFILAGNLFYMLVWIPIHVVGVLMHKVESRFMSILFTRARIPSSSNESKWGVRTYEPY